MPVSASGTNLLASSIARNGQHEFAESETGPLWSLDNVSRSGEVTGEPADLLTSFGQSGVVRFVQRRRAGQDR